MTLDELVERVFDRFQNSVKNVKSTLQLLEHALEDVNHTAINGLKADIRRRLLALQSAANTNVGANVNRRRIWYFEVRRMLMLTARVAPAARLYRVGIARVWHCIACVHQFHSIA